jgi:phospho-N-acetylmuramoyl-pentapeptide-transferase
VIAIFTAGALAILVAGFGTPILLSWALRRHLGQHIREDGPAGHAKKAGTPTMGGIAMLFAMLCGYLLGHVGTHLSFSAGGALIVAAIVLMGGVGFIDDSLKERRRRSLGLNKRWKFGLQIGVAAAFAVASVYWAHASTTLSFTRYDLPGTHLGTALWIIWATIVIVGASNAVNLTDGLDGLAAGSTAFAASCLTIIGYWEFRHLGIYDVAHPKTLALDIALVAISIAGACVGFLWWNAAPARIFMGDTGSLALGTGIACVALSLNVTLLLPIIGGLFVIETLSVVAQVLSFRLFHRRIFRMAPVHHHFELLGWPETTVIVRFWLLAALCTALGLGIFYADFLSVHPAG